MVLSQNEIETLYLFSILMLKSRNRVLMMIAFHVIYSLRMNSSPPHNTVIDPSFRGLILRCYDGADQGCCPKFGGLVLFCVMLEAEKVDPNADTHSQVGRITGARWHFCWVLELIKA